MSYPRWQHLKSAHRSISGIKRRKGRETTTGDAHPLGESTQCAADTWPDTADSATTDTVRHEDYVDPVPPPAQCAAQWCGPIELQRGLPGLLLTFECGLTVVFTRDCQLHTLSISAGDITSLIPRSRSIDIGLAGYDDIAPEGVLKVRSRDSELFQALTSIQRPAPTPSITSRQPRILSRPRAASPTVARRQQSDPQRRGAAQPRAGRAPVPVDRVVSARLATSFAPSAYAEHADGVLRACRWSTSESPPPVGTTLLLTEEDGSWSAALRIAKGQ